MAEIPLQPDAVGANAIYKEEGLLSNTIVTQQLADIFGVAAKIGGNTQENHRWVVLYRLAELLPNEYKYGSVDPDSGMVSNAALVRLDYTPYLNELLKSEPKDRQDNVEELIVSEESGAAKEIKDAATGMVAPTTAPTEMAGAEDFVGKLNVGVAGSEPPEQALRRDVDLGFEQIGSMPFSFTGVIGGQQFLDDYRRRNEEWVNQFTTDETVIDMPKLESLTSGQARQYIYGLSRQQVMAVQRMLGRAGYFNDIGRAYSTLGTVDDNTKLAWDTMLLDSARRKTKVADLLRERISTYANEANIEYTDPTSWINAAQEFGGKVLGRTMSGDELNGFLRAVRGWERDAALGPTVTGEPKVDVEARAQAYFDEQFANERMVNAFEQFNQTYMRGEKVRTTRG